MACSQFNPRLPLTPTVSITKADRQLAWLGAWEANLLNDACMQSSCGQVCLGGNEVISKTCKACLNSADCQRTLSCLNCIDENQSFSHVYNCTVAPGLSTGELVGIIVGSIVGVVLLIVLIMLILYKTDRLPIKTRLWVDSIGKSDPKPTQEDWIEMERASRPHTGKWGSDTGPVEKQPWEYSRSLVMKSK